MEIVCSTQIFIWKQMSFFQDFIGYILKDGYRLIFHYESVYSWNIIDRILNKMSMEIKMFPLQAFSIFMAIVVGVRIVFDVNGTQFFYH